MDSSPLEQAYTFSLKADTEVQNRQYQKASEFYTQAVEKYNEALKLTVSPEVCFVIINLEICCFDYCYL